MSQVDAGELGAEAAKVAKAISSSKPSADFAEFFTSHEGMQLDLEEALTRPVGGAFYNLSCHMLWIGQPSRLPTWPNQSR